MDPIQGITLAVLGYVSQWLRAFRHIDNAIVSIVLALVSVGLWFVWTDHSGTWQQQVQQCLLWLIGPQGVARASQEIHAAPPTNSIGAVPKG